jgi:hypothetical protein
MSGQLVACEWSFGRLLHYRLFYRIKLIDSSVLAEWLLLGVIAAVYTIYSPAVNFVVKCEFDTLFSMHHPFAISLFCY